MSTTTLPADTTAPIPDRFDPNIKITNNLGADVTILSYSPTSEYEWTFKTLFDANNATILPNGASATYELHESHYDYRFDKWVYTFINQLVVVKSDSLLFPIKLLSVLPNHDKSGYNDITLTQDDANTPEDVQTEE